MEQTCTQTKPLENKLLSSIQLETKPVNRSWLEDVEEHDNDCIEAELETIETDIAMLSQSRVIDSADKFVDKCRATDTVKSEPTTQNVATDAAVAPSKRDIVVEFLDTSNEEKYERLIKEEKIKTPLKRRCSSNSTSRSNSPPGSGSCGTSVTSEESNRFYSKKSKVDEGRAKNREYETNEEILARRQKQIEYGKNTIGYDLYMEQVPRHERTSEHPWTPPKNHKYSRRAFDGLIKVWRKKLHCYDPNSGNGPNSPSGDNE